MTLKSQSLFSFLLFLACLLPWVGPRYNLLAQTGQTASAGGLMLETLSSEELDGIQAETGQRAGVEVVGIESGSLAGTAGFREGDILRAVSGTPVLSAAKAAALLKAANGTIVCLVISINPTTFQIENKTLRLQVAGTGSGNEAGAANAVMNQTELNDDPVEAYFNLLDFSCTQAWGRTMNTAAADRQRVAAALMQGWQQMNAQAQAQIMALPKAWLDLQQSWKAMSETERNNKRAEWRDQILLPNNYFAPPVDVQRFAAEGNLVAFEFPTSWTGGWQVIDGTPFLFVGPTGQQTTWDRVLNTAASPAGALFALVTIDQQMRQLSWEQGARYLIQLLMPGASAGFQEVQVMPIGQAGAIITLRGTFPGQSEERFYWIGITPFGGSQVFAGRMGGPVKQAMELLPAFHHMLSTLQLNPPQATSSGTGSGAWDAAWSRVSTAIVADIWRK
jgi:hypothetical protein